VLIVLQQKRKNRLKKMSLFFLELSLSSAVRQLLNFVSSKVRKLPCVGCCVGGCVDCPVEQKEKKIKTFQKCRES